MNDQLSDRLIFARLHSGPKGWLIRELWTNGFTRQILEFNSRGEAEFHLLTRLAYFTGPDLPRIKRLYLGSALSRTAPPDLDAIIEKAALRTNDRYQPTPADFTVKDELPPGPLADVAERAGIDGPDYRQAFELGRYVKSQKGIDVEEVVTEYASLIGRNPLDFATEFESVYEYVHSGIGEGVWDKALALSESAPYPVVDWLSEYGRFASILYHTAQMNGGLFWINLKKMTELWDVTPKTLYRWVDRLETKNGLITCVDPTYDHRTKKSKIYAWTGPTLEDLANAPTTQV